MSEQTANPESTSPDAEGAETVDSSSEIEKLDESLSDMTSALLGEAGDDDMDFEGMFAEVEPPRRSTPATPEDTHAAAESDSSTEQAEASVSEQLDEIEAAVAAAIDEADAGLSVDEVAVAEPAATESEVDPAETPTALDDSGDAAEPSAGTPAEPEDPMEAVAQDLEATGDVAEGVAEPTPAESSEAPAEPAASGPEAEAEPESHSEESEPGALDAEVAAPDAAPVEPEAEVEPEDEATEPESATPPESSGEMIAADSPPEDESSAPADSSAAAAAPTAETNPDAEGVASSEGGSAPSGTDLPGVDSAKSPGGRGLRARVLAALAKVGPVAGRLAKPILDRTGVQVARCAEAVAGSFTGQPKLIRHSVAWIALWTLFNAGVVWAYLGLFRSGSPTPPEGSGTQITGASVAPESVVGAGAAGVPGMPASPSGR